MLDIKFIREHPEIVEKDLKKRKDHEKLHWVHELVEKESLYRKLMAKAEHLRCSRNTITKEINELKKQGKDASKKIKEAKELPAQIKGSEEGLKKLGERVQYIIMRLPNVLHESVPIGKDDTENIEVRTWGKPKKIDFKLRSHGELLESLDLADFKRASKISGSGFYFLKGDLMLLEQALIRFVIDMLVKKGFTPIAPPFLLGRKAYEGVTDLEDFENVMYHLEGEKLYLIATSEHPVGAMHTKEIFNKEELPIKYCGLSACFRKEIGSRGVDTKGLFRVHQFNKVEQFVFCKPEDSWKIHEELIANAENVFKKLKIPYRIVNICTGDMGTVAAKKYDLEAWFPRQQKYGEMVSCSNCTGYQATRLNIRFLNKKGEKEYVHTLNSTAVATGRALVAIIENYQNKDGTITVPEVLVPYMNGIKKIGKAAKTI
ncbi:MAG: serine--tRNA ligase [bacterium]|nr:serine--tRNA ligase [bacterium]